MVRQAVSVRMPEKALELLSRVSSTRGETVSSFIRRAVLKELASLSYLSLEEKKALGLNPSLELREEVIHGDC